jgi:hypothetical protein
MAEIATSVAEKPPFGALSRIDNAAVRAALSIAKR